jgi:hypothetical protein
LPSVRAVTRESRWRLQCLSPASAANPPHRRQPERT